MTTLKLFSAQNISVPASTSWYLADLGEFRGKQELYMRRLKAADLRYSHGENKGGMMQESNRIELKLKPDKT